MRGRARTGTTATPIAIAALVLLASCGSSSAPAEPDDASDDHPMAVSALDEAPVVPTVIVVDASGSMATDDAPGQRLQAAKDAVSRVLGELPNDHHVGIVVYGTSTGSSDAEQAAGCQDVTVAVPVSPYTKRLVADALDPLQPSGYTPIGASLQSAAELLPSDGPGQIIVVSDGIDTCAPAGLGPDPCQVAGDLHAANDELTVSTVGFRIDDAAATDQLACIADVGGGVTLDAATATLLGSRLSASLNADWTHASLQPTGYRGATLGMSVADVAEVLGHGDVADAKSTGTDEAEIPGATLAFTEGALSAITLTSSAARTVDGLAVGDFLTDAEALYGTPSDVPGVRATVQFVAGQFAAGSDTCWRLAHGASDQITEITLAACA